MEKNVTAWTSDFQPEEDSGLPNVQDGQKVTIGGMITDKTVKYTKTNKVMAFLTIEDLVGTVEVVVFPRDYEKNVRLLNEDEKVFVQGRVSAEDEKASKLICEKMYSFAQVPRELWLQFADKESYVKEESHVLELLRDSDGKDSVVIFLKKERAIKRYPANRNVRIDESLLEKMHEFLGASNVKVVEKSIEKQGKIL